MTLSPATEAHINRGKLLTDIVGQPAIAIWNHRLPAPSGKRMLVLFDQIGAEHPQPVAMISHSHDDDGELERRALSLFRNVRKPFGEDCVAHSFNGVLAGLRVVVAVSPGVRRGILMAVHVYCIRAINANAAQILAA